MTGFRSLKALEERRQLQADLEIHRRHTATRDTADGSHMSVYSQGYSTRRSEIVVANTELRADLSVDPERHFDEVTTVTGNARSQFEVFQPTAVLAAQELSKQLEMSLGATLENPTRRCCSQLRSGTGPCDA